MADRMNPDSLRLISSLEEGDEPTSITGVSSMALLFKLANVLGVEHSGEERDGRSMRTMEITQAILKHLGTA